MTTTGDVLDIADATGDDLAVMSEGSHYDYVAQTWVDGHDHAHFDADDSPLQFCGADWTTCRSLWERHLDLPLTDSHV